MVLVHRNSGIARQSQLIRNSRTAATRSVSADLPVAGAERPAASTSPFLGLLRTVMALLAQALQVVVIEEQHAIASMRLAMVRDRGVRFISTCGIGIAERTASTAGELIGDQDRPAKIAPFLRVVPVPPWRDCPALCRSICK